MDVFSRFRLVIVAAIAIPLAVLFAVLWSMTDSHQSIERAMTAVKESRTYDEYLTQIQLVLTEAESAQRSFLLTGQATYLRSYERAAAALPAAVAQLDAMRSTAGSERSPTQLLKGMIEERMTLMAETVRLARAGDRAAALAMVEGGEGVEAMQGIRLLTQSVRLQIQGELTRGRLELNERLRSDSIAAAVLACCDLIFLAGIAYLVLRVLNLQQIATICAWSKTIRYQDQWISFEEYLRRKFGVATTHGISREMAAQLLANRAELRRDDFSASADEEIPTEICR